MTHFEYISIAGSIVYALTLGRLMTAAPYVFKRTMFDPLFAAIYSGFFMLQLVLWWVLWGMRDVAEWDFFTYFLFMATPLGYYLCAYVLVSDEPKAIESWSEHYASISRLFAGTLAVAFMIGSVRVNYVGDSTPEIFLRFTLPVIAVFTMAAVRPNIYTNSLLAITLLGFSILRVIGESAQG